MTIQTSGVKNPGDLKEFKVTMNDKDITSFVMHADIYQDILTPGWTVELFIVDSNNLLINIPIKHATKFEILIDTDFEIPCKGKKKFNFNVFSIKDKNRDNANTLTYTIVGVTEDLIKNQTNRISKSFNNKKPETIISEAIGKLGCSLDSDSSDKSYSFISPNWSPFTVAMEMAKVATHNKAADFLFFITDEKKYAFKSFESLFNDDKNDCGITFKQKVQHVRETPDEIDPESMISIQGYQFAHYDSFNNMSAGFYASKIISHDIINKSVVTTKYSYSQEIKSDEKVKPWDTDLFDNAFDSNVTFMPRHPGLTSSRTPQEDQDQWSQSRKSNLLKLAQDRLIIQVPGSVCLWKTLGKHCTVELPQQEDVSENKWDKYYKGKYLITAIRHSVSRTSYTVNIELVKKRLAQKMKDTK